MIYQTKRKCLRLKLVWHKQHESRGKGLQTLIKYFIIKDNLLNEFITGFIINKHVKISVQVSNKGDVRSFVPTGTLIILLKHDPHGKPMYLVSVKFFGNCELGKSLWHEKIKCSPFIRFDCMTNQEKNFVKTTEFLLRGLMSSDHVNLEIYNFCLFRYGVVKKSFTHLVMTQSEYRVELDYYLWILIGSSSRPWLCSWRITIRGPGSKFT